MKKEDKPFFVGYLGIPKRLKGFLLKASLLLFAGFAAGGVLAGVSQDDPGQAGFRFDFGRQTVSGVIEPLPYPVLHVTEGNDRIRTGRTVMLTGQGKNGVMGDVTEFSGSVVNATGIILRRGALDMMQLAGGKRGLKLTGQKDLPPASEPLGKWRLQGEICDGKCLAGAMQPGRGLAHKACAILCVVGDIPPVFVSTQPVEGSEFLMIGGVDGGPLSQAAYGYIGKFIEVEAEIERRGDLLVMLVDPETIKVVR